MEQEIEMVRGVLTQYPLTDVIELIIPEGGVDGEPMPWKARCEASSKSGGYGARGRSCLKAFPIKKCRWGFMLPAVKRCVWRKSL